MTTIAIVDYDSGNLHSAHKAVMRAAADMSLRCSVIVTADPKAVAAADRVILPGVGAFADCRAGLDAVPGMVEALTAAVHGRGRPFLGICVGMQLLATRGLEHVTDAAKATPGLDWIGGDVVRITPDDPTMKVPHMGWNTIDLARPHPVFDGIATGQNGLHAYFVHSYHLEPSDPAACLATADYGCRVTAAVASGTVVGVQFHPEKSQALGLALLANFLRWSP